MSVNVAPSTLLSWRALVPAPVSVAPSSGLSLGGLAVVIAGTGIGSTVGVAIGGTPATLVIAVSDVLVTAVTPPNPVGTYDVSVTTLAGTRTLAAAFTVTA